MATSGLTLRPPTQFAPPYFLARGPPISYDATTDTLTFLFTDIEGSTSLLRRVGSDTYAKILEHHHVVVRDSLRAHHGEEQGTQGDSFFAVFRSPSAAVVAAVEIVHGPGAPGCHPLLVASGIAVLVCKRQGDNTGFADAGRAGVADPGYRRLRDRGPPLNLHPPTKPPDPICDIHVTAGAKARSRDVKWRVSDFHRKESYLYRGKQPGHLGGFGAGRVR